MRLLVIIPARGGSKGIIRKNVRNLNGRPLIHYTIELALKLPYESDVYVDSDDDEILWIAGSLGAKTILRKRGLAQDETPLDPVVFEAVKEIERIEDKTYDFVLTLQPTSPLLALENLTRALETAANGESLVSVSRLDGFLWRVNASESRPLFEKRVNRQFFDEHYLLENGAFVVTHRNALLASGSRFAGHVRLFEIPKGEDVDIDDEIDWGLAERILVRKRILFVVVGNRQVGMGHIYRVLTLMDHFTFPRVDIVTVEGNDLVQKKLQEIGIPVTVLPSLAEVVKHASQYDLVVNDILDTDKDYVLSLKKSGLTVINLEDLGTGALFADLVVNDIYEEWSFPSRTGHVYWGHRYYCARNQFVYSPTKLIGENVQTATILFGGTDENNLTQKVLEAIYPCCLSSGISVQVILGLGYDKVESLSPYKDIVVKSNIQNMAQALLEADIIFSALGRTTYEVAILGVPAIVLAQNDRELHHSFASENNGFINLGLGADASVEKIRSEFESLVLDYEKRSAAQRSMLKRREDLIRGRNQVVKIIESFVYERETERRLG